MLKYDFQPYSPASRHLVDFDEADCAHPAFAAPDGGRLLGEEAERTARAIAAAAPARIARGSITREEADRQAALFAAIAADLAAERTHLAACRAHFEAGKDWRELPEGPLPRAGDFSWEDKLHVLRRELHFRRRYDGDRVARGRMTAQAAREQLERLEAIQDKYWRTLFCWQSPTAAAVGAPAWRAEVRAHTAALELASTATDAEGGTPAEAGAQTEQEISEAALL